jgi:hypothetical protein
MAYIKEILDKADKNINTLKEHIGNKYLRNILEAAYLLDKKLILPDGVPPYKENTLHESQTSGQFWQIARKIDIFYNTDIKPIYRERAFITALESISKNKAKIFIAIKEQNLEGLYPNITFQTLKNIGYFK